MQNVFLSTMELSVVALAALSVIHISNVVIFKAVAPMKSVAQMRPVSTENVAHRANVELLLCVMSFIIELHANVHPDILEMRWLVVVRPKTHVNPIRVALMHYVNLIAEIRFAIVLRDSPGIHSIIAVSIQKRGESKTYTKFFCIFQFRMVPSVIRIHVDRTVAAVL